MGLTKELILAADDLPREKIAVPEWGGDVWVRALTASERDALELSVTGDKGTMQNLRARLAVLVLVDEKGARLFSDGEAAALGAKSAAALDRVFTVGQKINALSEEDVEGLVKN